MPFSRRERATDSQKSPDLAREAVGWNGGLGGWQPSLTRSPHARTTPAHNHPARRTSWWNHIPHSTTPAQRTIASDHSAAQRAACTGGHNEQSAQRALVPPQHHEQRHDGEGHDVHLGSRRTTRQEKPADHITPAAQRPAIQLRRTDRSECHYS